MNEDDVKNRISLPVSRWHRDNMGDLLADCTVHIDEVCDHAVGQLTLEEQRIQHEQSEREFEEWLAANQPPNSLFVDNDF